MQPGEYNLTVYRGDKYYGPVIPLFSLVPWGGPSNPTASPATMKVEVKPQKNSSTVIAEFNPVVVDENAMTIRLTMDGEDTDKITRKAVWDLQVTTTTDGPWTLLAGKVTPSGQVTD